MPLFALCAAILISISVFLLLQENIIRKLFGTLILSSTLSYIILICGRLNNKAPAFVSNNSHNLSNPLPQAMILTAIVIAFALIAYLSTLIRQILFINMKNSRKES